MEAKNIDLPIFFVYYYLESKKSSGFASDFQIVLNKGISSLSAKPLKLPHPSLRDTFSQNSV